MKTISLTDAPLIALSGTDSLWLYGLIAVIGAAVCVRRALR